MSYLLGILRIVPLLILTPGLCLRCSGQLYESNLRLLAGECVSNAIVFQSLGVVEYHQWYRAGIATDMRHLEFVLERKDRG